MKELLKRVTRKAFKVGLESGSHQEQLNALARQLARVPQHPVDQGTQRLLTFHYQQMVQSRAPLPSFDDVGFRSYSQNDEDGVLLYIFALIGTTNKTVVEVCAGTCIECNAANLIINHYWRGLLFDGSATNIETGRAFYAEHPNTLVRRPHLVNAWITPENINALIEESGVRGEIDLLSFDMDGMDYWVLEAIECIRPRVIVLEHNSPWGAARSVTVPYQHDFAAAFVDGVPEYCGASLPAFVKLLKKKGYRLVGLEALGINAFFVQNGIGEELLPEVTAESCFGVYAPSGAQLAQHQAYLQRLETKEYVEI